jgi:excisionase family DNA binding protein
MSAYQMFGDTMDYHDQVLMSPSEVAKLFRVDPKTVIRWAENGKLTVIRTLGGHRRFQEQEVLALLEELTSVRNT